MTATSTTVPGIEEPPTCEEWMVRPVAADEVEKGCAVPLNGGFEGYAQAGMVAIECDEGHTIFWADAGWGYVGEPMHAHDRTEVVAPQAERTRAEFRHCRRPCHRHLCRSKATTEGALSCLT